MTATYDVIVIGLGGVGSAAALELARRGASILGLEQFQPGHTLGSSHGRTRAIRQAYFEHPDYVPLLLRSYELWKDLEHSTSRQLFHRVGLLEVGTHEGELIPGVLRAARQHNLPVWQLDRAALAQEFPQFHIGDDAVAVWEENAGYLAVEDCVQAQLESAEQAGARLQFQSPVTTWHRHGSTFHVSTPDGSFQSGRLVMAGGAWMGQLHSALRAALQVVGKRLYWFGTHPNQYHAEAGCPVFFFETAAGFFYGFPAIDPEGVKVGEHSGGEQDPAFPQAQPERENLRDAQRVTTFLRAHLPGVRPEITRQATCWYTMSPDHHFMVGQSDSHPGLAFAAGLSGHGFKFVPLIGEVLADLVLNGRTGHPVGFLHPSRFGAMPHGPA